MPRADPEPNLYDCLNLTTKKEISISQGSNNFVRIHSVELCRSWYSRSLLLGLSADTKVAMKEITRGVGSSTHKDVCNREFLRLKELTHDNIVLVFEMNLSIDPEDPSSLPSYLMEIGECSLAFIFYGKDQIKSDYIVPALRDGTAEGETLIGSPYTKDHLFCWLEQVANALRYLHERNLIHRDVKGTNVLLFREKTVCKLCDFDTCRMIELNGMTPKVGTNRWRAPELRKPNPNTTTVQYGRPADCYSFGILLCEGIFREFPFQGYQDEVFEGCNSNIPEIPNDMLGAMRIRNGHVDTQPNVELSREKSAFNNLPADLWTLLNSLISWNPEDRPHMTNVLECLKQLPRCKKLPKIVIKTGHKTDTGSAFNARAESHRSQCQLKRMTYSLNVSLREASQERVIDVFRDFSRNISVMSDVPDNQIDSVRHEFTFQRADELLHDIKSADAQLVNKVFDFCSTNSDSKFTQWMGGHFTCDSICELRTVRFDIVQERRSEE